MRNIRLTIEYDGKCYNGWQKQPDKLNIQGEIERAIFNISSCLRINFFTSSLYKSVPLVFNENLTKGNKSGLAIEIPDISI